MSRATRAVLIAGLFVVIVVIPFFAYRDEYTYHKRLREIDSEKGVYRSGEQTAAGLTDAVQQLGIRLVVNLQEDVPDPDLYLHYWTLRTVKESELCREIGVKFVQISPDLLVRRRIPRERPRAIEEFLALMDDPSNYPVLIHCRAGLHRTGCLAAVYRMEYQGWSRDAAWNELRAHGFGEWVSTAANDYIQQYILSYKPGLRRTMEGDYVQKSEIRDQKSEVSGQRSAVRSQKSEVRGRSEVTSHRLLTSDR